LSEALGVEVTDLEVTPVGTGQTGSSHRLCVTYADAVDLPGTFVAKTGAEDPEVRQRVAHGYRAEFAFYERLAATVDVPVPTASWRSAAASVRVATDPTSFYAYAGEVPMLR